MSSWKPLCRAVLYGEPEHHHLYKDLSPLEKKTHQLIYAVTRHVEYELSESAICLICYSYTHSPSWLSILDKLQPPLDNMHVDI